ncbi:MAG: pantetheine-phosphate adenylyltransferase [Thermodesulfobacteriota bacterium]
MSKRTAIYPGSFDPFTNGHLNIINRASKVFDKVIVSVAHNVSKKTVFSIEERVSIIKEIFKKRPSIEVDSFEGLLVEYAKKMKTNTILRGMRSVSDFEYEFQMALANKSIDDELETVFMVTDSEFTHISSSLIKEIITLGGSAKHLVPKIVEKKLKEKIQT